MHFISIPLCRNIRSWWSIASILCCIRIYTFWVTQNLALSVDAQWKTTRKMQLKTSTNETSFIVLSAVGLTSLPYLPLACSFRIVFRQNTQAYCFIYPKYQILRGINKGAWIKWLVILKLHNLTLDMPSSKHTIDTHSTNMFQFLFKIKFYRIKN